MFMQLREVWHFWFGWWNEIASRVVENLEKCALEEIEMEYNEYFIVVESKEYGYIAQI